MAKATGKPHEQARQASDAEETLPRAANAEVVGVWQFSLATVAALLIGAFFMILPQQLLAGPRWLLLALEVVLLAPPVLARVSNNRLPRTWSRGLVYALLAVLTVDLLLSLGMLVQNLPNLSPHVLLTSGLLLWGANVLVFASWYWETDGDGPVSRHHKGHVAADFRFPQQEGGAPHGWHAGFVDYLFLAFCTATALSPADVMPLTRRAKILMMVQAVISMVVIVMLLARFVNVV